MKKFNIEIELTDEDIDLLTIVNWEVYNPQKPYGRNDDVISLCEKGIIIEYYDEIESGIHLTNIGKQIINFL